MRRCAQLLVVALALAVPATATAANCPQTTLAAIEAEVMCPVCGTPLGLASEAPQANRERALIQRLVDRCMSEEQIKDVLVAEYGEEVLALPDGEGFELTAYLVPAALLLLTLGGLIVAARRWRGSGSGPGGELGDQRPLPESASKRLDADLERYDL